MSQNHYVNTNAYTKGVLPPFAISLSSDALAVTLGSRQSVLDKVSVSCLPKDGSPREADFTV